MIFRSEDVERYDDFYDCRERDDADTPELPRRRVMAKAAIATPAEPRLTARELSRAVLLLGRGWTKARVLERVQATRHQLPFGSEVA